jgi:hypothetical protein
MSMLDQDFKYLGCGSSAPGRESTASTQKKDLPIERFAGLIDTEEARFDK